MYYDRDGIPIPQDRWVLLHQDRVYVSVLRTKVLDAANPGTSYDVSTVWLGLDHSLGLQGPPTIFETMVFMEGGDLERGTVRYPTEALAREGHTATVVTLSAELDDPVVMDV